MSDAENLLQTIKTTVQDIVAPDVRGLKAEMVALGKRMESVEARMGSLENQIKVQFDAFLHQSDAQFRAIMAAIEKNKAENELLVYRQIAPLSERLTAVEARQQ